jgi:hypothetical protein
MLKNVVIKMMTTNVFSRARLRRAFSLCPALLIENLNVMVRSLPVDQ